MPGKYEADNRLIVLNTEMDREPLLTAATLIHHLVGDLLHHNNFEHADFPELVDLAVISTGLGLPQSQIPLVKQSAMFWDSTFWFATARPFLDSHNKAYANAMAAWVRGEKDPEWSSELPNETKRAMRKSLKYLRSSNEAFFNPQTAGSPLLKQSQGEWLKLATDSSTSRQIIALRYLQPDKSLQSQQESLLTDKLRSTSRAVVLHAISATELAGLASEPITGELQLLVDDREDEVRAKAMIALAKLNGLNDMAISSAAKMVDGNARHVVYAGTFALASQETLPEDILEIADRGFIRALQSCDYEFVAMFAAAFTRWMDDPRAHIQHLLQDDQPDYLEIAMEALDSVNEQAAA
ncbi:MAG: hypothetical protein ACR2NP_14265 [Pirellulaceae bacterium]